MHDFRLEDVWALPRVDGPDGFARLVQVVASFDPRRDVPLPVRALFAMRSTVGRLLGWDGPGTGIGSRVASLRDRLPPDLRDCSHGRGPDALPFTSLYLTENEWAVELANRTVHGVLHIGRSPDDAGGYDVHLAVYVKANGPAGNAYLAAIRPFRHLVVYPAILRAIARRWQEASPEPAPARVTPPMGRS